MFHKREQHIPKIVVIGGGTGSFTLLQALRDMPCDITALVNMADDGGSTGMLRDELGVLPPGDVRQCLVALSEAPAQLRALFSFRFPEGSLKGHSFGNLFLSAVEMMTEDFSEAVRMAGEVLRIKGRVLPMTTQNCQLALTRGASKIVGEHRIGQEHLGHKSHPELSLVPAATILPEAAEAIAAADLVVIAPGNLYASLAPALLVGGVAEALQASKAKVAFVCNLVNKQHHTDGFDIAEYADEIERFIGAPRLDYVLYNIDTPSKELLDKYAVEGEFPVAVNGSNLEQAHYNAIGGKFLSHVPPEATKHDVLQRSLIRHDARQVAATLMSLVA